MTDLKRTDDKVISMDRSNDAGAFRKLNDIFANFYKT